MAKGRGRARRKARRSSRRSKPTRAERKASKRQQKYDFKLAKKSVKFDSKDLRAEIRGDTKQSAYEAGIDPNAWISSSVKSAAGAVAAVAGAKAVGQIGVAAFDSRVGVAEANALNSASEGWFTKLLKSLGLISD